MMLTLPQVVFEGRRRESAYVNTVLSAYCFHKVYEYCLVLVKAQARPPIGAILCMFLVSFPLIPILMQTTSRGSLPQPHGALMSSDTTLLHAVKTQPY
jgi:hypothetical protein